MNTRTRKRNFPLITTIDLTIDSSFSTENNSDSALIELTSPRPSTSKPKPKVSKKSITAKKQKKKKPAPKPAPALSKLGECPVCLEEVGTSGDAIWSTKCGHLFCCVCLLQTLEVQPNCPTCREDLNGPGSHHPLHIGAQP